MDNKMNHDDFLKHEKASLDTIDVKRAYIIMAGDIASGVLLSQIIYWNLPDKSGNPTRLTVKKKDHLWLAKKREDWWNECCMLSKQFDRAIKTLEQRCLVKTELFRFDGSPTKHIRINWDTFLEVYNAMISGDMPSFDPKDPKGGKWIFPNRENPTSLTGNNELPEQGITEHPLTSPPKSVPPSASSNGTNLASSESTSENTTKIKDSSSSSEVVSSKVNSLKKEEEETNCFEHKDKNLDKYKGWGFNSLFTQFKHMLKNKDPQREITGIVFTMLDILGVKVKDKKDKPTFAIASKVRKCGDKHSADLLWKMWVLKQDGMLTSPDGYLYKVINSIQGEK